MRFFLDKTVSVYRFALVSDKESYSLNGTVTGHLQPMDTQTAILQGETPGQAFTLYTDQGVDMRVSDKITIDSVNYIVSGKEEFNFGSFPHTAWKITYPVS